MPNFQSSQNIRLWALLIFILFSVNAHAQSPSGEPEWSLVDGGRALAWRWGQKSLEDALLWRQDPERLAWSLEFRMGQAGLEPRPDGLALGLAAPMSSAEEGQADLPVFRKLLRVPLEVELELEAEGAASRRAWAELWPEDECARVPIQLSKSGNASAWPSSPAEPRGAGAYLDYLGQMGQHKIYRFEFRPLALRGDSLEAIPACQASISARLAAPPQNTAHEQDADLPPTFAVVSHRDFEQVLQPFLQWKRQMGYQVRLAFTDEIGQSPAQIRAWATQAYLDPEPGWRPTDYLLLVGDVAFLPAFQGSFGSHVTDLPYAEYTGDLFPEVLYGRFSANTPQELQNQIDKTLAYEKYLLPQDGFLDRAALVAGADAAHQAVWGNGQINYARQHFFTPENGFQADAYLQPLPSGSQAAILQSLSLGGSLANYTAHCSANGWSDPPIGNGQLEQILNYGKYWLMVGNCCQSNRFNSDCFGERVLRLPQRGAIGYIGASNDTYWDEDYWWAVGFGSIVANPGPLGTTRGFFDRSVAAGSLAPDRPEQGYFAQGANLAVTESGSRVGYYWEVYHLMGDPSVKIYWGTPQEMSLAYAPSVALGQAWLDVQAPEGARVALSRAGELVATALADASGLARLSLAALDAPCQLELVATAANRVPHLGSVEVLAPQGPFVVARALRLAQDGQELAAGQEVGIGILLENLGGQAAESWQAVLRCDDAWVELVDTAARSFSLAPGDTLWLEDLGRAKALCHSPDGHLARLSASVGQGGLEQGRGQAAFRVAAPRPSIALVGQAGALLPHFSSRPDSLAALGQEYSYAIGYTQVQAQSGGLEPGESVDFELALSNQGTRPLPAGQAWARDGVEGLRWIRAWADTPELAPGDTCRMVFSADLDPGLELGQLLELAWFWQGGCRADSLLHPATVGQQVEDFETGDFSAFDWQSTGASAWLVQEEDAWQGRFAARSGDIMHNQSSGLKLGLEVLREDMLSFGYKVSAELGYDLLRLYVNGEQAAALTGAEWSYHELPIVPGWNELEWRFTKDQSISHGLDAVLLDAIRLPVHARVSKSGEPLELELAEGPPWLWLDRELPASPRLRGVPPPGSVGEHPVALVLRDPRGREAWQRFALRVDAASHLPAAEASWQASLSPNPSAGKTILRLEVPYAQAARVELFDARGIPVGSLASELPLSQGENQLVLDQELAPGLYIVRVAWDQGQRALRWQVIP